MTDTSGTAPDMTAAELALGLLEGEERAAALRRVLADPAFARDVEDWRDRLAGLFDDYPEVAAPRSVADRLVVVEQATRTPARATWSALAGFGALAAAVALFFVARPDPAPMVRHRVMAASLITTDGREAVPALVDTTTGEMRVGEAKIAAADKAAQLWMIGADGVPRSMGLLAPAGPSRMELDDVTRKNMAVGIMLAVSIEPAGGSPTGKPTGPVVASGKLLLT